MFNKEMTESIIEDCLLRMSLFNDSHNGRARNMLVRICVAGVDGGGLSTYGKSAVIGPDDHYECHRGYLYVYRKRTEQESRHDHKKEVESVAFIPYESIIAIECAPCAYV